MSPGVMDDSTISHLKRGEHVRTEVQFTLHARPLERGRVHDIGGRVAVARASMRTLDALRDNSNVHTAYGVVV